MTSRLEGLGTILFVTQGKKSRGRPKEDLEKRITSNLKKARKQTFLNSAGKDPQPHLWTPLK